jgi:uncharacterized protein (DUF1697 family)
MPTYIAFLRGVNVGGNILKMERLRAVCAELGLAHVRTYVQSGNVVFAARGSAAHWSRALEQNLLGSSRLAVSVMVRTATQLARVATTNPFLQEPGIDQARLAVVFLNRAPERTAWRALDALGAGCDRFHPAGTEIYLHCPTGFARTKLTNNAVERTLAVRATTRNWNTVTKLVAMAAE